MQDAFGIPQSLLVLGGSSEIALAIARRLVAHRTRTVLLAGRPSPRLDAAAAELRGLGADARTVAFDAEDTDSHEELLGKLFADGDIDMVLLAFGVLGDPEHDEERPQSAVRVARTNYTGALSAGLVCGQALRRQGHGTLAVLSSFAAVRARRGNFVYGSSKAGLDAFAQGLGDALYGTGARVMVVRPGFVRTRMTSGLTEAPLATDPDTVAAAVEHGLRRRRETVWVPGGLRLVAAALRLLPRPLFRRLTL
ncbi:MULTISPECIES: decaprenylphospho-beta-D-erythro-pentofuranosid-2-ulose 2-reductase [Streptomyces]|uniref:Decaprenylphospho-beta-D-erythro-pentofuranosid-2-ulose 2-reductase n=1 Tax=Streptomyces lycii TaxID=2654337 RepID=A0ABQ7FPW0_9ACTN|nr:MULTISPECIES: decaprenylphospho-beta-D-erythro-pentofuranosid-2-ulose 2-reductase [Streptomyces]KAF4409297.1 decaprenylphospho-beta-D-erythro-pentofuranosid-2-ulose 2-reductase [Streptomyces lycii]PGH48609.1 decaprenylphospho-beta-D-erythro-pentofuranosid-2-ulose 2-reductase [Streptomyces sp. Ru87]